ncbi:MAG: type II toxin-antitoxin system Phd/YefM family antitoxin [Bosea sp. (in: a-proteobacteria)]
MHKGTTKIGYRNTNGQVVERSTGLPGTDHNQTVYALRCEQCDTVYGVNGSDIHRRLCPNCGGGRPGLPLDDGAQAQGRRADEWAVADAKARLSELIDKAVNCPLTITRNGKPVAIVVGVEEWKRRTKPTGTLAEFFQSAPDGFQELQLERAADEARHVEL